MSTERSRKYNIKVQPEWRTQSHCKRRLEARARIAEAICSLEDEGIQISIAEVARRAKADWRTVKKNWDLMAVVLTSDNLEENRSLETETNKNLLACSGGVISLGGLPPTEAVCSAEVGDCLESVFVHRDTNTFSPDANIAFQDLASDVDYTIMETPKVIAEPDSQAFGNALASKNESHGNSSSVAATNIFPLRKMFFILPYGSQRRPQLKSELVGSDSVPLRRLLCEQKKSKNKGPPRFDR